MATQTPLEQLYPFLAGGRQAAAPVDEALAESVRQKAAHHVAVFEAFFAEHLG